MAHAECGCELLHRLAVDIFDPAAFTTDCMMVMVAAASNVRRLAVISRTHRGGPALGEHF